MPENSASRRYQLPAEQTVPVVHVTIPTDPPADDTDYAAEWDRYATAGRRAHRSKVAAIGLAGAALTLAAFAAGVSGVPELGGGFLHLFTGVTAVCFVGAVGMWVYGINQKPKFGPAESFTAREVADLDGLEGERAELPDGGRADRAAKVYQPVPFAPDEQPTRTIDVTAYMDGPRRRMRGAPES